MASVSKEAKACKSLVVQNEFVCELKEHSKLYAKPGQNFGLTRQRSGMIVSIQSYWASGMVC